MEAMGILGAVLVSDYLISTLVVRKAQKSGRVQPHPARVRVSYPPLMVGRSNVPLKWSVFKGHSLIFWEGMFSKIVDPLPP